jgi:hypothetical protein
MQTSITIWFDHYDKQELLNVEYNYIGCRVKLGWLGFMHLK